MKFLHRKPVLLLAVLAVCLTAASPTMARGCTPNAQTPYLDKNGKPVIPPPKFRAKRSSKKAVQKLHGKRQQKHVRPARNLALPDGPPLQDAPVLKPQKAVQMDSSSKGTHFEGEVMPWRESLLSGTFVLLALLAAIVAIICLMLIVRMRSDQRMLRQLLNQLLKQLGGAAGNDVKPADIPGFSEQMDAIRQRLAQLEEKRD